MQHPSLDPRLLTHRLSQLADQSRHALNPPQLHPNSSPIATLPPEILIEVFKFALPTERFASPSTTSAPLSLVHVCRHWRHLARALPELWSSLHLNYRSEAEDNAPTRLWLALSGDRPLSISLSLDFDEKPHQAIIDTLVDHSKRWKHVRFEFRNLQCPKMYDLCPAMDRVPMLSSFEFYARSISTFNIEPISQLLSTAPSLKELSWVDDLADAETLHSLPLPRLSRLSLSMNFGTLDYLKLFNVCSNLEHVRISRPFPDVSALASPLILPKLNSLNIAHDLTGILDNLILPSLKRLRVHMDPGVSANLHGRSSRSFIGMSGTVQKHWDPKSLLRLVERSSCEVEILSICAPTKVGDFVKCLEAMTGSLKSLNLSGGATFNRDIVSALTPDTQCEGDETGAQTLCPHLVELNIDSIVPGPCSLVDMVQKRLDPVFHSPQSQSIPAIPSDLHFPPRLTPLKRLSVRYPAGHKDIPSLRELASQYNLRHQCFLKLSIVESRMGTLRGSSAGRTRMPLIYRQKASESR